MINQKEIPRLKRNEKSKITLYFDKDVEQLYRVGKHNGYDVSEIIRKAASEALRACADVISKPAE